MKKLVLAVIVLLVIFAAFAASYGGTVSERLSNAAYDLTFFFRFINNHATFLVWVQFVAFVVAVKTGFIRIGKTGI